MKVRLTKLSDNANALRTNIVEGITEDFFPDPGDSFVMLAPSLSLAADIRLVQTSTIQKTESYPNHWEFWTENSHYKVEQLDDNYPLQLPGISSSTSVKGSKTEVGVKPGDGNWEDSDCS